MPSADIVVVGGGILGLATASAVLRARPGLTVIVLEKEGAPAAHQSGRNSGVLHSGVYYRPGSLKARTVATGRRAMLEFCATQEIAHQVTGKVIVATDETERPALRRLHGQAEANGVPTSLIGPARLAELEPHAVGVEALHVPGAAIVDFAAVCRALVRGITEAGGEFLTGHRVRGLTEGRRAVVVDTDAGDVVTGVVVNCAGLHSDRLAVGAPSNGSPPLRIVPFRGEYFSLVPSRGHLVATMIYPVPDPRFPFLGVHFTRGVSGEVHAGPNAVLALAREGYSWRAVDVPDTWDLLGFPGFRRLAVRHWRMGLAEIRRSLSRTAFVRALQRLVPEVEPADLIAAPAGVRAQAVDATGALVDDFVIRESPRAVHLLNAPSPAATAALEIGRIVAERAVARLEADV